MICVMRLTSVTRAAGMTLARELPAVGAVPLLQAGATLTAEFCQSLSDQGIGSVWVSDALSEGITPAVLLPQSERQEAISRLRRAVDDASEAMQDRRPLSEEAVKELSDIAARIAANIKAEPEAELALVDLARTQEDIHAHSVDVTALGLALGHQVFRRNGWVDWDGRRRRDRIEDRLVILGLGLLLHDIGKLGVPREVLAKQGRGLNPADRAMLREHVPLGVDLLRSHSISLVVKAIVRDHHEHWDGRGYPRKVERADINPLARIAAVADHYVNHAGRSPADAVAEVVAQSGKRLDAEIVDAFRRLVFPYPVGTEVDVDDGIIGVVCHVDPARPEVPTVRFQGSDGPIELPIDTRKRAVSVV